MPITVEEIEPNLICMTYINPVDHVRDPDWVMATSAMIADRHGGPIVRIGDATRVKVSFSHLVTAIGLLATRRPGSLRDGRIINIIVSPHPVGHLAAEFLSQRQLGELHIPVFETRSEAIAYARELLAEYNTQREQA
ncbi:MAG: hypothetical protein GYB68_12490 [Chloroflexi bacterium]|nr:hypothetical protein [Chloroflexota bacterium]